MTTFPQLPWMSIEVMQRLVRQQDLHLLGCLTTLSEYAAPDGDIQYVRAVRILTAASDMNEREAENAITRLVDAGWVVRTDETLSIIGYGSSVAPDYVHLKPD